ncbi:14214_t:CDS:2, partial [Funneliformis caledonium]
EFTSLTDLLDGILNTASRFVLFPLVPTAPCLCERNMLIRPTKGELENYGTPDFTIYNAGAFPANCYRSGMTTNTSVAINFHMNEMVIFEPSMLVKWKREYADGDISIFFGTGKTTTLSADPKRFLIGDDEHCLSDDENTHCAYPIELIPNAKIPYRLPKLPVQKEKRWNYIQLMFGLINTGWNVDAYVVGKRIKLKYSCAIIDAIHSGELAETEYEN